MIRSTTVSMCPLVGITLLWSGCNATPQGTPGQGGSTGGSISALGGSSASVRDASSGTGGASSGTGGASSGTGGASSGTGGASSGTGGASSGTGGASSGTGDASSGTGGASSGTGDASVGTGGASSGTGGASSGTGDASSGTGGASSGTGGASSGTGGASSGTGGANTQGCRDSSAYVGNSAWPQRLQVNAGADYCGGWRESRTLEQELAAKAKLHIAPGAYPLPDTAGTYSFALPVCVEFPSGRSAPAFSGAGQLTLSKSTHSPDVYFTDDVRQPLTSSGSSAWSFQTYLRLGSTVGVQPAPLVFDGTGLLTDTSTFQVLQLCTTTNCSDTSDIEFESCNPTTYALNRTTVTFDGGQAVFDARIATLPGGISESPMFVVASGSLDSTAFDQRDYWRLVYSATHHQFSRRFAVLFDSPINGACGLKVMNLDPFNGSQLPQVSTVRCDLSDIATRSVSAAVTERL